MSLLDERIRRSGVKATTSSAAADKAPPSQSDNTAAAPKQTKLKAK